MREGEEALGLSCSAPNKILLWNVVPRGWTSVFPVPSRTVEGETDGVFLPLKQLKFSNVSGTEVRTLS